MATQTYINASIKPLDSLDLLSPQEVKKLQKGTENNFLYDLFRQCSLAVLNTGSDQDNTGEVLEKF